MSEKKREGGEQIKIKIHIILFNNLLKLLLIYKRREILNLNPDLIQKNILVWFLYTNILTFENNLTQWTLLSFIGLYYLIKVRNTTTKKEENFR